MDLTVAICMYNAEKYISETLECLFHQTISNFKILVVDDCSTDNSKSIINDILEKSGREYELIALDENQGIAYARNYCLNHATTKYLMFIDADDLFEPDMIQTQYEKIISDDRLIGVCTWCSYINPEGKAIKGGIFLGAKTCEEFIERSKANKLVFFPIHVLMEREYAIKAGGFTIDGFPSGKPRYRDFCEDMDLWTRMSDFHQEGKAMITIPKPLYHYRKGSGLSSNHFNMIIKMRYTKNNLLKRRSGKEEQTFIDFINSLPPKQLNKYKKDAKSADNLRNGVFYLKKMKVFKGIALIISSIWLNPGYIVEKINNNLIKRK